MHELHEGLGESIISMHVGEVGEHHLHRLLLEEGEGRGVAEAEEEEGGVVLQELGLPRVPYEREVCAVRAVNRIVAREEEEVIGGFSTSCRVGFIAVAADPSAKLLLSSGYVIANLATMYSRCKWLFIKDYAVTSTKLE